MRKLISASLFIFLLYFCLFKAIRPGNYASLDTISAIDAPRKSSYVVFDSMEVVETYTIFCLGYVLARDKDGISAIFLTDQKFKLGWQDIACRIWVISSSNGQSTWTLLNAGTSPATLKKTFTASQKYRSNSP